MNTEKQKLVIVTHNGTFHADDIFSVATLFLVYEKDRDIRVIRTRDMDIISQADIVLDVGGEYDPDRNKFDHHQSGGAGIRENGIKYAAFGLIWKKYGEHVCGSKEISDALEQKIVMPIDAMDNGQELYTPRFPGVYSYGLGDLFSAFKVTWKEDRAELDTRFMYLVDFAKEILQREIKKSADKLEAKQHVLDVYVHATNRQLLVLDTYYPWEVAVSEMPEALLVVHPDLIGGQWCMQAVREDENTFTAKILFPESWAGLRGEVLEKATGVSGAVFCHTGRFFAVAKTKEAILKLAEIVL